MLRHGQESPDRTPPLGAWARFDLYNCSLARIEWKTVLGQQVTGFNDVGHLPWEIQTYG